MTKDGFYIQGYLPTSFNPDFILETNSSVVVAIEYKGEHLADLEYKKEIGSLWGGLHSKYKFVLATKKNIEEKISEIKKI